MPIAVIAFDFDPLLHLGDDLVIRWQTIALAAIIAATLFVTAAMARRTGLHPDDLLYIAIGIVPGGVIAGRLGYALTHLDGFVTTPLRVLDPGAGGLDLAAGVVGGILTGAYVASLLGAPVGRWAHVAAVPLLAAIGAGKLAMVLGGSGQGLPWSGPWATAFLPPGPWNSLAAALPSHPAQAYEGVAALGWGIALALVAGLVGAGRRDGRLLCAAVAGWAFLRAAISITWRDPVAFGPFSAGGWLAIDIGIGAVVALILLAARRTDPHAADDEVARDPVPTPVVESSPSPAWPDPESRPRF